VTNGLGRRVVAEVLAEHFGRPVEAYGTDFAGKTDPQIFRELLTREGARDVDRDMAVTLAAYQRRMAEALTIATITPLAGALELAATLAGRTDLLLGLLTGNLQALAYAKVGRAGFGEHTFRPGLGAFGSDHEDRDSLGAIALARAVAEAGRPLTGAETIIVGDTPRDIACARAIGAVAVAVASSNFSADALREADIVLESLAAPDELLGLLE
jgi:phosphoglycolate phosphatase-like HAD superfamily hydrolase